MTIKHYSSVYIAEYPVKASAHPAFESHILLSIVSVDVAWPIDLLNNLPYLSTALDIVHMLLSRTISDNEKLGWLLFTNS